MASRADTLKIARADLHAIGNLLFKASEALDGQGFYANARIPARHAVEQMEGLTKRLRRSFALDNG